jgi:hypothetical protein
MLIMPSNNSGIEVGYLAGRHDGRIGWLISPGGWRRPPAWLPYALDNGAFTAWKNNKPWDAGAFMDLIERAQGHARPLWIAVPDVVADAKATIALWPEWSQRIHRAAPRVQLAFVVQDGMTAADVPADASVIFVGGSTDWKWSTLSMWAKSFPRIHVGRVNTERRLWQCHEHGVESCDGTGWMRGDQEQIEGLRRYLRLSTRNDKPMQMVMEAITE